MIATLAVDVDWFNSLQPAEMRVFIAVSGGVQNGAKTTVSWIAEHTGIRGRHVIIAALRALESAGKFVIERSHQGMQIRSTTVNRGGKARLTDQRSTTVDQPIKERARARARNKEIKPNTSSGGGAGEPSREVEAKPRSAERLRAEGAGEVLIGRLLTRGLDLTDEQFLLALAFARRRNQHGPGLYEHTLDAAIARVQASIQVEKQAVAPPNQPETEEISPYAAEETLATERCTVCSGAIEYTTLRTIPCACRSRSEACQRGEKPAKMPPGSAQVAPERSGWGSVSSGASARGYRRF